MVGIRGGAEQEASIFQQETVVREWCAENGYRLARIFKDEALSGTDSIKRLQFQAMISHFHNGATEAGVVVWKFSRFARNLDDAQFYRADLRRRGYQIYSLKDTIPSGPEGRFFEAAIDWMNARYSSDLSSDIKRGLESLRKNHRCISVRPPVGYMRERVQIGTHRDGSPRFAPRWVIDPDKADLVRRAFDLRAQGETYKTINELTHLFASGDCFVRFFRNPIYIGHLQIKGHELQYNFTDPIVDETTWQAVQQRVQHDMAVWSHPRRLNSRYLLSGLVQCGVCGGNLFGYHLKSKDGKRYDYYRCDGAERPNFSAPKDLLERAVLEAVNDGLASPEYREILWASYLAALADTPKHPPDNTTRLETDKKENARELRNITEAIKANGYSETLLAELKRLERRKDKLNITPIVAPVEPVELTKDEFMARFFNQPFLTLEDGNQAEIRKVLRALIANLVVIREGPKVLGRIVLFTSLVVINPV